MCVATFTDGSAALLKVTRLGAITATALKSSVAPGMSSATFTAFAAPVINNAGRVAFRATIAGAGITSANNTGIWADTASGRGLLARIGGSAPGISGGIFGTLGDPVSNNLDRVAFLGSLRSGACAVTGNCGIWVSTSGRLGLVARTGGQAPECPSGAAFAVFRKLLFPNVGGAVFLADLTLGPGGVTSANNQGIWAADSTGQPCLIIRKGNAINVDGTLKIVAALSAFTSTLEASGQPGGANVRGDVIYRAIFTDGTQALLEVRFQR